MRFFGASQTSGISCIALMKTKFQTLPDPTRAHKDRSIMPWSGPLMNFHLEKGKFPKEFHCGSRTSGVFVGAGTGLLARKPQATTRSTLKTQYLCAKKWSRVSNQRAYSTTTSQASEYVKLLRSAALCIGTMRNLTLSASCRTVSTIGTSGLEPDSISI